LGIIVVPLSWLDSILLPPGSFATDMLPFGRVVVLTDWLVWMVSSLCDIFVTMILPFGNVFVLPDSLDLSFPPLLETVETTMFPLDSVEVLTVGVECMLPKDGENVRTTMLPLGNVEVLINGVGVTALTPDDVGTTITTTPPLGRVVVVLISDLEPLADCMGTSRLPFGNVTVLLIWPVFVALGTVIVIVPPLGKAAELAIWLCSALLPLEVCGEMSPPPLEEIATATLPFGRLVLLTGMISPV